MSFIEDMELAVAVVKKVKALADTIESFIGPGGNATDMISVRLSKEDFAMVVVALRNAVEGL